jgi:hypothetical protein
MRGVFARFEAETGQSAVHAAARPLPIWQDGPNDRPSIQWKARKPWQDRRMLFRFAAAPQTAASRRLAHGFHPFAKTMKDDRNVRYSSC